MAQTLVTDLTLKAWSLAGPWGAGGTNLGLYTPEFTGVPSPGGGGSLNIDDSSACGGGLSKTGRRIYNGSAITGTVTVSGILGLKADPWDGSTRSLTFHAKCELALADQNGTLYPLTKTNTANFRPNPQTGDYIWEYDNTTVGWNSASSGYGGEAPNYVTEADTSVLHPTDDGLDHKSFVATADVTGATELYLCMLFYYRAYGQTYSTGGTASYDNANCKCGIKVQIDSAVFDGGGGSGAISVNDGGTIKGVGKVFVNDSGTIKECRVYVNDGGTIKQVL